MKEQEKTAMKTGVHQHVLEDGTVIEHTHSHEEDHGHTHSHGEDHGHARGHEEDHAHSHSHAHSHGHTHQNTKAVLNRMARAAGHLDKVRNMVEQGEDCSEVLIQLSAVISALNGAGKLILKDHMEHCMVDAVRCGDMQMIEELTKAIDRFIK